MGRFLHQRGACDAHCCALMIILSLTAGVAACSGAPETAGQDCAALLAAADYPAALARCDSEYAESDDPAAGRGAAIAAYYLQRDDDVLAWLERLRGTQEEATVLGYAASVYRRQGQPERGVEASERKIALHEEAGEYNLVAGTYYTLYRVAWNNSDFRGSLDFLQRTYENGVRADDPYFQNLAIQGLVQALIGIGDLKSANRALQRVAGLVAADDRIGNAYVETWRGIIEASDGRLRLGRGAFERALELAAESEDAGLLRSIRLNLVEVNVKLGDIEQATAHLQAASALPRDASVSDIALLRFRGLIEQARGDYAAAADTMREALALAPPSDSAWELETQLGLAAESRGEPRVAEAAYERAIGHVEGMRSTLGPDDLKAWLLDEKRQPYERLFALQADQGRVLDALATLERAKARTFLDAVVRETSAVEPGTAGAWAGEAAGDRLDSLLVLLPALGASPAAAPRPIDALLPAIAGRAFVAYFEAADTTWAISSAAGGLTLRKLEGTATELAELVDEFVAAPDDVETATRLGNWLMPEGLLPDPGSELHLIVDGALGRLPFAAVRIRGRPLVRDHVITYLPSLNVLAALVERGQKPGGPPVVLGDPHGDLVHAAIEVEAVAERLGVTPAIGTAATAERFADSSTAWLLHLATHTGLGPSGPWLSLFDGDVEAGRLVTDGIGPGIVVLATCASAAREGKGMWGSLGGAFLAAGSEAVVASLWSIGDELAHDFVDLLYAGTGDETSAAALARVQRAFIAAGRPPSDWGPFVHFGSARPMRQDPQQ